MTTTDTSHPARDTTAADGAEPATGPGTTTSVTGGPRGGRRTWLAWTATALAFPPSGLAATALGPVDDPRTALLGGAVAGLGIGAAQWLVLRSRLPHPAPVRAWAPATAAGLGLGLAAGASLVGWRTGAADLAVQGALSGLGVGAAQGLVLAAAGLSRARAALWALATPLLWALGWSVTRAAGIDVERQYAVFGASGALASSLLAGALVAVLLHRRATSRRPRSRPGHRPTDS